MENQTKNSEFVNQIINKLKGDDNKAIAVKIQTKAVSVIKAQLAAKNVALLDLEENIEKAKANLLDVKINKGKIIVTADNYIKNLLTANKNVKDAEEDLENHKKDISFLTSTLKEIEE